MYEVAFKSGPAGLATLGVAGLGLAGLGVAGGVGLAPNNSPCFGLLGLLGLGGISFPLELETNFAGVIGPKFVIVLYYAGEEPH